MKPTELLHPEQRRTSKAYLANKLRKAVFTWREHDYPHTTDTTLRLLQFWFEEDHAVHNEPFEFWFCQREAIETLIHVYEVMKVGEQRQLYIQVFTDCRREYDISIIENREGEFVMIRQIEEGGYKGWD